MAKLTKSRARKPLAESTLSLSGYGAMHQADGEPLLSGFGLGVFSEAANGASVLWQLKLDRAEAQRVVDYLTRSLAAKVGEGVSQTLSFRRGLDE